MRTSLDLDQRSRKDLMNCVLDLTGQYREDIRSKRISPTCSADQIKGMVLETIEGPKADHVASIERLIRAMESGGMHNTNPRYFGLFTPRTPFVNAIAEFLRASYNPNLGSWDHAPFAVEAESVLVQEIGKKLGYPENETDGVFSSGGAEGNLHGILCALENKLSGFDSEGLASRKRRPLLYCSSESHHSIVKATRMVGLGSHSIRLVRGNNKQRMNIEDLELQIARDLHDGHQPFMVISTAGTTGSGAVDPLKKIHVVCKKYHLWHHVDAAYGGALIFHSKLRSLLSGIEDSDSVSIDLHKWPAAPVGTNVFLTRDPEILHKLFSIEAKYMPPDSTERVDPYRHSPLWSRRFIGLSFLTMLAVHGWEGYEDIIESQTAIGNILRQELTKHKWQILNQSEFPLVCFSHPAIRDSPEKIQVIAKEIVDSGQAWISTYEINGKMAFRACITNYATNESDVRVLINLLNEHLKKHVEK